MNYGVRGPGERRSLPWKKYKSFIKNNPKNTRDPRAPLMIMMDRMRHISQAESEWKAGYEGLPHLLYSTDWRKTNCHSSKNICKKHRAQHMCYGSHWLIMAALTNSIVRGGSFHSVAGVRINQGVMFRKIDDLIAICLMNLIRYILFGCIISIILYLYILIYVEQTKYFLI